MTNQHMHQSNIELSKYIKSVTSRSNTELKKIRSLALRKHRDAESLFIAEGLYNAVESTRRGWELHTLVLESGIELNDDAAALLLYLKNRGRLCMEAPPEIMAALTKRDNAREAVAVFEQRWDSPCSIGKTALSTWIALEEIRDPGNLGTIIRTAAAVGVEGIILVGRTCDPFSIESIRASAGSFARMRFVKTSQDELVAATKQLQHKLIGTHLKADIDYRNADYTPPLILMMGNEQAGLSDALAGLCAHLVKIPMTSNTESLNVSVATGVMLYEIFRTRL